MSDCEDCRTAAAQEKWQGGAYTMDCLQCCARLLATTRPQSPQAAAMLHVIQRAIDRANGAVRWTLEDVKAAAGARLAAEKARAAT